MDDPNLTVISCCYGHATVQFLPDIADSTTESLDQVSMRCGPSILTPPDTDDSVDGEQHVGKILNWICLHNASKRCMLCGGFYNTVDGQDSPKYSNRPRGALYPP